MASQTLTRFADLLYRTSLREDLQRQTRRNRLPPVLLFTGPPGVGKRSLVRALAAWRICPQVGETGEDACGNCSSCVRVAAGTFTDLRIVTSGTKKEIGIDRAREIRQFVQLQPAEGSERIVVIEDAERLTIAAQNALLKTLEEPTPRARIWLTANLTDSLLPTIRSRCAKISVPPLSTDEVREILQLRHGMDADTAAELAALSEGSVGRALALASLLDDGELQRLHQILKALPRARYRDLVPLVEVMAEPEGKTAGKLEYLLAHFRAQALAAATPEERLQAVRRARIVYETWQVLRDSYPNRNLLLESLMLRLTEEDRWT